ncbi:MAG: hypothetical protein ACI4FN_01430 [Acutalibacteraceae bacterium]
MKKAFVLILSALSGVDATTLINYGKSSQEGRLNGYGILVELRGKGFKALPRLGRKG